MTDLKLMKSSVYCNTEFLFWINTVLLNFWFIKKSWKSITGPKKYPTLIINQNIRMIIEGPCDTENWSNDQWSTSHE